jgi:hypothetical protein
MVLTFFYFVVPELFKNRYLNCFYENNCAALLKAVPESLFRLTDVAVRALAGFSVSRLCTLNRVSESCFISLLAGFSKPDMIVNIGSSSSAAYRRVFTLLTGLLKPGIGSLLRVSVRFCIISKCFHRSSFKMYV